MDANLITTVVGLGFLFASWMWPEKKWGGLPVKLAFSSLSVGILLAKAIYVFF